MYVSVGLGWFKLLPFTKKHFWNCFETILSLLYIILKNVTWRIGKTGKNKKNPLKRGNHGNRFVYMKECFHKTKVFLNFHSSFACDHHGSYWWSVLACSPWDCLSESILVVMVTQIVPKSQLVQNTSYFGKFTGKGRQFGLVCCHGYSWNVERTLI